MYYRNSSVKDYLNVASTLGVTHLVMFTESSSSLNFRIGTIPRGPTVSFKVLGYSTCQQVSHIVKHPFEPSKISLAAPLLICNDFDNTRKEHQLLLVTLQNMFPPINVNTVSPNSCKRVVLFQYNVFIYIYNI